MMRPLKAALKPSVLFAFSALALGAVVGCDRPPSGDMKQWTPADHDRAEEEARKAQGAPAETAKPDPQKVVIDMTWRTQCVQCHGPMGKGDGPQGPMVKAPDLTRDDWQGTVTDDQIAATIQNGKGRMPKFDLPPDVLSGIVARVRSVRGK